MERRQNQSRRGKEAGDGAQSDASIAVLPGHRLWSDSSFCEEAAISQGNSNGNRSRVVTSGGEPLEADGD